MAIVQTVLGPNSSMFTTTGSAETPATMMAAVSAYIVSKGWTVVDTEAPMPAFGLTAGHAFRAPHASSDTTLKYVNIAIGATNGYFVPHEGWNASTHVGSNPYNYVNQGGTPGQIGYNSMSPAAFNLSAEDTSVVVFAHPRWLAMRMRSHQFNYGNMQGVFEISKDYGEAPNLIANAFISTATPSSYPGNSNNGFFGVPAVYSTPGLTTGSTAATYTNVLTAVGTPIASSFYLYNMTNGTVQNFALTMMMAESAGPSIATVKSVRGRIFGAKLLGGQQVWNDMDTVPVPVDSNYFQTAGGTPALHHVITIGVKFLIPA